MKGRRVLVTFIAACATVCIMTPSVAQAAVNLFQREHAGARRTRARLCPCQRLRSSTRLQWSRGARIRSWHGRRTRTQVCQLFRWTQPSTRTAHALSLRRRWTKQTASPFLRTASHNGDAVSIIPTFTGTLFVRVINSVATAYYASTVVMETSLFSPWWFTGGTNQAYVELRNNMNGATTGTLTFYASTGAVCGTSNFSLTGNGNTAVLINGVGTCVGSIFDRRRWLSRGSRVGWPQT